MLKFGDLVRVLPTETLSKRDFNNILEFEGIILTNDHVEFLQTMLRSRETVKIFVAIIILKIFIDHYQHNSNCFNLLFGRR